MGEIEADEKLRKGLTELLVKELVRAGSPELAGRSSGQMLAFD